MLPTNVSNDLYRRTHFLLVDFPFSESSTISHLFNAYCMSMYSRYLWRFNNGKKLKPVHTVWRKSIRRIWKLDRKIHNN